MEADRKCYTQLEEVGSVVAMRYTSSLVLRLPSFFGGYAKEKPGSLGTRLIHSCMHLVCLLDPNPHSADRLPICAVEVWGEQANNLVLITPTIH